MADISRITLEEFRKFRDEFHWIYERDRAACCFCPVSYECDFLIKLSNEMNVNSDQVGCDEIFEIAKKVRDGYSERIEVANKQLKGE